jgi:hypothetical protein
VLVAGLLLALPTCQKKANKTGVKGSGVGTTKTRSIGAFSALRVGGGLEFEVSVGKALPLEISGDDNLVSHVTVKNDGDLLVLGVDAKLKQLQPLRVRVGTERLDSVAVAIAAKGKVSGVRAESFRVEAGGGGQVEVAGSSRALEVTTRSASRVNLSAFSAATASVTAADASTVDLGYLEALDVTQTGLSRVIYRGDPKLTQKITKPARLIRRD